MMLPRADCGPPGERENTHLRIQRVAQKLNAAWDKIPTWTGLSVTAGQLRGVSWASPTPVAGRRIITETDASPLAATAGSGALPPRLP